MKSALMMTAANGFSKMGIFLLNQAVFDHWMFQPAESANRPNLTEETMNNVAVIETSTQSFVEDFTGTNIDSDQTLCPSPSLLSNQEKLITSQNVTAIKTCSRPQITNNGSNSQNSSAMPSTEDGVSLDQVLIYSAAAEALTLSRLPNDNHHSDGGS